MAKNNCSWMPLLATAMVMSISSILCFNFETRLPIVKYGATNTYFGYSVASHTEKLRNGDKKSWILVGAPLGQNLQPLTNRSGALFKCPVTQMSNDCEQVETDGRRKPSGVYETDDEDDNGGELGPPGDDEIKSNQWLGVTVRSGGKENKIFVCAHRYMKIQRKATENGLHMGQGLCYVLNNDFSFGFGVEVCSGRSIEREHEQYAFCQSGTSGMLLDDGTAVIGTPGVMTWKGTVFVVEVEKEFLSRDKTQYYGPHDNIDSPVPNYGYLGMAVTGGRYFGDFMSYAGGAPRSRGNGLVVIFSNRDKRNPIFKERELRGEQFGSSFGYELATADVNGDHAPDLLVAAPFYFSKSEGGAVYVYQNVNNNFTDFYTTKLTGKLESRFGLAMANLGDINKDGCEDIAIGAPYEGKGVVYIYLGTPDGLSKKPSQIITSSSLGLNVPALNTFGSSLSGGLDLDNNTYPDLVIGAYDSSAVVTLLARPITNIKTYVISDELQNIDPTKQGCPADPSANATCFSFNACCSIEPYEESGHSSSQSQHLKLIYTIEAETYNNLKKFSRVYFGPDTKNRSNILRKQISVITDGRQECRLEVVYIKDNTRDIQNPIRFRLNYTILDMSLPTSALDMLNPILDQTQADRTFEATFQKDCGNDGICQSKFDLKAKLSLEQQGDNSYSLVLGRDRGILLNVSISNLADSAYETHLFVKHDPSISYSGTKSLYTCVQFNATVVDCSLGNPMRRNTEAKLSLRFDPQRVDDLVSQLSFQVFVNTTSTILAGSRSNAALTANVIKRAKISISGRAHPEQTFYGGDVKGESAMETVEDIGTAVQHVYVIYNDGPWRAPKVQVTVQWPHQVANDKPQGKWLLYLTDTPSVDATNGGDCVVEPHTAINPLGLKKTSVMNELVQMDRYTQRAYNKSLTFSAAKSERTSFSKQATISSSESTLNRVKRDRTMIIRAERLTDKDGKQTDIVNMDCKRNTAKCVTIVCNIYDVQPKAQVLINVTARLWNSTLVSDYPKVDLVKIASVARIKVFEVQQVHHSDSVTVETLAYPELQDHAGDGSIPIWIIVLAILFGLLALALLIYILKRCGFFKRRRPDPTLSGNLEKSSESKPFIP
ncbi:integrin alpha-PS1 isoform X1 [Sabethes cyaneus]|uniref:integrin alpha-PS1 isoform X1 n=1 Tax=Sabethes cyaneus TaxID=53552 RepID=UPI00237E0A73|nr:integrin alpha-PS1 isoform X1 [Sabethes cyaneus]XP_053682375.1 integrin alpha-PS1 isoform X1 [Sabethes cyaneus]XP_053682376.1 integrin alpha-PS1 isoform X1 [Sabethes cyaneus]XP_053682377.1 integrin alpha-PS1 isoform X1 [Sabethes cyaneus]XP_053682378.1 integrin alpha-PS1 isoform X1 [Sabethes cyaneus]XP_053682379.1 integrin alpha-PS1 isoform X1 [Sabethes cyaneus]